MWSTDRDPLHGPSKDDDMSGIERKAKGVTESCRSSSVKRAFSEVSPALSSLTGRLVKCDVHVKYFADMPVHIHY